MFSTEVSRYWATTGKTPTLELFRPKSKDRTLSIRIFPVNLCLGQSGDSSWTPPRKALPITLRAQKKCRGWPEVRCLIAPASPRSRRGFARHRVRLIDQPHAGQFSAAYSHVGLINCALSLSRQTGPAEERAESEVSRVHAPNSVAAGGEADIDGRVSIPANDANVPL